MEPLRVFGIPITPIGYYMNCMLTNAQIEWLASDVSVIDYDMGKKKNKKKGEYDNTPASASSVRKANEEWLSKYGDDANAGKGLSINDIFKNGISSEVGVKVKD